jgi:hypothetical protein
MRHATCESLTTKLSHVVAHGRLRLSMFPVIVAHLLAPLKESNIVNLVFLYYYLITSEHNSIATPNAALRLS